MGSDELIKGFKTRRTYYGLKPESPIPDDKIHEIVQQAVLHTPSSFNSQSTRVLVLLGDEHKKLWENIVKPAVKAVAPPEAWEGSEQKLSGFAQGYGTILVSSQILRGLAMDQMQHASDVPRSCAATNQWPALH